MTSSGMGNFNDYDRQVLSHESIHDFDVFGDTSERIGKVVTVESRGSDQSAIVVVKIGSWLSSREVALPLQRYQVDLNHRRLYLEGWTKEAIERMHDDSGSAQTPKTLLDASLPLESSMSLEEPVIRTVNVPVYNVPVQAQSTPLEASLPLDSPVPLEESVVQAAVPVPDIKPDINQDTHAVPTVPQTSVMTDRVSAQEVIPLLSERVVVDRQKRKAGEVVVRKVIETEVVEVLVRREKLIVEQVSPAYKELAVIDLGETSVERAKSPEPI
jgi:stress response protein YsnF